MPTLCFLRSAQGASKAVLAPVLSLLSSSNEQLQWQWVPPVGWMLLPGLLRELSGLAGLLPGMKMHKENEQLGEVISDWALPAAAVAAAAFSTAWQNPLAPLLLPAPVLCKLKQESGARLWARTFKENEGALDVLGYAEYFVPIPGAGGCPFAVVTSRLSWCLMFLRATEASGQCWLFVLWGCWVSLGMWQWHSRAV